MTSIPRDNAFPGHPKATFFGRLSKQWQLVIMSVPMLLYVLLFNYAPLWGWINAFRDISNERGTLIPFLSGQTPAWYGIKNFTNLFSANAITFQETLRNTLAMSLINLVFGTVSAIVLAVLLNEVRQKSFKRTVQTVTYLPHFLSMIIVVGMAQIIFDSSDSSFAIGDEDPSDKLGGELTFSTKPRKLVVTSSMRQPADVHIYSVSGQSIATFSIQNGETIETDIPIAGVYIIRAANGRYTKKFALK